MFEQIKNILGKPIDDPAVVDFLTDAGIKYPAKPYISNRAGQKTYWLENKKKGFDLLFGIQVFSKKYTAQQASKKGIFNPILIEIRWYNNKSGMDFPFDTNFDDSFDGLIEKLGQPLKSSEQAPVWLNEDGSESWYRWKKILDATLDIQFALEWQTSNNRVKDISISIVDEQPLFYFYIPFYYENLESFLAKKDFWKIKDLFFIQWALDKGYLAGAGEYASEKMTSIDQSGALSYIKNLGRGYLAESDFAREGKFARWYIRNLSDKDIVYQRDFALHFLTDPKLRNNYRGEDAEAELNKIECTPDNYLQIAKIIDSRFAELK